MKILFKNIVLSTFILNLVAGSSFASYNTGGGYYYDPSSYPQGQAYQPYAPRYAVTYFDHGQNYDPSPYQQAQDYQAYMATYPSQGYRYQPTRYMPPLAPSREQQYPTLAKALTFIQDEAQKQRLWLDFQTGEFYQQSSGYIREQTFIFINFEKIRPGFIYKEFEQAAVQLWKVINHPQFKDVDIMRILAIMPDAELKEIIAAFSTQKENPAEIIEGEPVQLMTEPGLTEHLKSLQAAAAGHIQGHQITPPEGHRRLVLRKVMDAYGSEGWLKRENINGFGSSLIVVDTGFDKDSATDMMPLDVFVNSESAEIAHGSLVAACAASKQQTRIGSAMAYGAKVLPILAYVDSIAQAKINLRNIGFISNLIDSSLRREDDTFLYAARKALVNIGNELIARSNSDCVLDDGLLNRIEEAIIYCRSNNLSPPRVINMSLRFLAKAQGHEQLVERLVKILSDNDMLMVVSAGNDGKENNTVSVSSTEEEVDIRCVLNNFPKLAKRLILTGAVSDGFTPEDYSNLAGDAMEHTIFACGFTYNASILNPDHIAYKQSRFSQGTSFAAPRVAGLAVVLGKYFPQLTMTQIKDLILKSAFKPANTDLRRFGYENFDPRKFGQGVIYPSQAWHEACQLIGMKG